MRFCYLALNTWSPQKHHVHFTQGFHFAFLCLTMVYVVLGFEIIPWCKLAHGFTLPLCAPQEVAVLFLRDEGAEESVHRRTCQVVIRKDTYDRIHTTSWRAAHSPSSSGSYPTNSLPGERPQTTVHLKYMSHHDQFNYMTNDTLKKEV